MQCLDLELAWVYNYSLDIIMIQTEGIIFQTVQSMRLFPDSKTFVDAILRTDAHTVIDAFKKLRPNTREALSQFVQRYFTLLSAHHHRHSEKKIAISNYIKIIWSKLTRHDHPIPQENTQIVLPYPYIIPGDRFKEMYYWDTYFTMLGFYHQKRYGMIENSIRNLIYLQQKIGWIPNGSRTYLSSRSQPPVLILLVDLLYQQFGIKHIEHYLPALEKEHTFWMTHRKDPSGHYDALNRYCDPLIIPRPESYFEDITLAHEVHKANRNDLYQALRSAAESGWDFSSRWMADDRNLNTLQTQYFLPIDLNALLYLLEEKLSHYFSELNDTKRAIYFHGAAQSRRRQYHDAFWHQQDQCFYDYNIKKNSHHTMITAAMLWALFAKLADKGQAQAIKQQVEATLLQRGGLMTTTVESGQQWDAPNGWAALQWIAVQGLCNYGYHTMAEKIKKCFCHTVAYHYSKQGVILEKYDVCDLKRIPNQGEYETQIGFGWTNGVYTAFECRACLADV